MHHPTQYKQFPGKIALDTLDDLFTFHADRFGGYRMEEEVTPEAEGEKPAEETAEKPAGEAAEKPAGEPETPPGEGDEGEESKLSHEDALKALAKVRKENAATRTRLREAEDKLKDAKTPEEFEAAKDEILNASATDARDLLVENVALRHKLPDELADALKGETKEELEAHAKVLAKFATPEPSNDPDLGGGLDPNENPDGFDAKAEAQKMRKQRRRGR